MTFEQKKLFLYVSLPMRYDGDSSVVDYFLEQGGYKEITEDNIEEATKYCVKCFEKDLWEDNVAKQLLQQTYYIEDEESDLSDIPDRER